MPWPRALVGLYALFNIIVGIEAYVVKGSLPSIIGGVGIGVLLLGCFFYLIPNQPRAGYISATVITLFVAGRFLKGVMEDGVLKVWPNLTLGLIALGVAGLLGLAHFMARAKAQRESAAAGN